MSTLLLTNIGNRNILYKGKSFSELSRNSIIEKDKTFRQWSSELLDSFDSEKGNIELNILPPLLEKLQGQFDVLVLFYSNQLEGKNDQDTIYETMIIEKLLQYQQISYEIISEEINGSVINNNTLLQYYRSQLNFFNLKFNDPAYLICDAGGTAQCKSALKISAEFVLDHDKFQVYYVNPMGAIEEVGTDEYRSIINKEQSIALIQRSEYLATINILGFSLSEAKDSGDFILKLLRYMHLRKNGFFAESLKQLNSFKNKDVQKHDILEAHKSQNLLGSNNALIEFFGGELYEKLIERLYHVKLYESLEDYSEMILKLSVFYEEFLNIYIELEYGYELSSNYFMEAKRFVEDCNKGRFNIDWKNTILVSDDEIRGANVPVLLEVMRISEVDVIKNIFKILIRFFPRQQEKRINILRNKIAHNGLFLDFDGLSKRTPSDFPQTLNDLIEFFDLKYRNIYNELNGFTISSMRAN